MLQLQQVRTHSKGMLIGKEGTRNTNMFQMRQEGAYSQRLQRKTDNEERKVQEDSDNENKEKEQGFGEDLK